MTDAPLLLMAAGGTGGHMFPAQALAEAMLARGWRVTLSTDDRGARYTGGFPEGCTIGTVASATPARGGIAARARMPFIIARGTLSATRAMRRDRPAAVIGFGGYPSIPAMAAARLLKLPRMIHEQNGVLGRVNRRFASHVDLVACGTWPTDLPDDVATEHTGNPVRAAILARAAAPYIPPGDYPMSILVMGGSQGARILSDIVPPAISALPRELRTHIRVAHQARPEDHDRVTDYYEGEGIAAEVKPFFDDVPDRMAECQLVISRSGASSVADIAVIGRPSILVPYAAAAGDHQTANARALRDARAAIVIGEADLQVDTLSAAIARVLNDPRGATHMSQDALSCAIPDATDRLVAAVERLAGPRQDESSNGR